MKDIAPDRFDALIPCADSLRLRMGELTSDEVLVAQAAYRLALVQTQGQQADRATLAQIEQSVRRLAEFAEEHGACSPHALANLAEEIARARTAPAEPSADPHVRVEGDTDVDDPSGWRGLYPGTRQGYPRSSCPGFSKPGGA